MFVFQSGIKPPANRSTSRNQPITEAGLPPELVLPLQDRLGPLESLVSPGEEVTTGELLAVGAVELRSPVDGRVRSISRRRHPDGRVLPSLVISPSSHNPTPLLGGPPRDRKGILRRLYQAGIVGMGGAAFPAHLKLSASGIHEIILNGSECEPVLTADERLLREDPEGVLQGGSILAQAAGARRIIAAVERDRKEALDSLRRAVLRFPGIRIAVLPARYPQGAERLLIKAVLGRSYPVSGRPSDVGVVVQNVATAWAAGRAAQGYPLLSRIVTVAGVGISRPGNYRVLFGTPLGFLLGVAGYDGSAKRVVTGGPLTGLTQPDLDAPILPGTAGVITLGKSHREEPPEPCLRCGKCTEVCPVGLSPLGIASAVEEGEAGDLEDLHPEACLECGSCSYSCPSRRPLLELIRIAREEIRR